MQAIRKCLGWQHGAYQRKLKGIHQSTYGKLFMEYVDVEGSYISRLKAIDKLTKTY